MAMKKAILKMKIEGILQEIWLKSGAEMIVVDQSTGETLATRLAQLGVDIDNAVAGGLKESRVQEMINAAIDQLVDGAPEAMNTLKEVTDWIATHKNEYDALLAIANAGVKYDSAQSLTDEQKTQARTNIGAAAASVVETLSGTLTSEVKRLEGLIQANTEALGGKVDKVDGKGLSTNDYTNAEKTKLAGVAEGATKVAKSDTNGNIKVNDQEVKVYEHPTTEGNIHLPEGGTVGQVLRAGGNGTGAWGENVRSGTSEPADLAEGELFVQFID